VINISLMVLRIRSYTRSRSTSLECVFMLYSLKAASFAPPLSQHCHSLRRSASKAPATNGTASPSESSEQATEVQHSDHDKALLERYLQLWTLLPDPITRILTPSNTEPPSVAPSTLPLDPSSNPTPSRPSLLASLSLVPKNPTILKGGYLLTPSADSTRWVRRFVELRRPYLMCILCLRGRRSVL
jgi:kinesin family protein 1